MTTDQKESCLDASSSLATSTINNPPATLIALKKYYITEVVVNNPWVQQTGRAGAAFTKNGQPVRYVVEGIFDGVDIRVITTADDIITAFPIK